ncbi:MAG: diacylglycerol kinase family protein [Cyclobacteriaceae bacterium]
MKSRLKSFSHAYNGMKIAFSEEPNFKIQIIASLITITSGLFFRISSHEWLAIILSIALVMSLEAINTAIKNIADFIHPEKNIQIKRIKDISAGAVLIGALTALAIGFIIFIPKIYEVINVLVGTF